MAFPQQFGGWGGWNQREFCRPPCPDPCLPRCDPCPDPCAPRCIPDPCCNPCPPRCPEPCCPPPCNPCDAFGRGPEPCVGKVPTCTKFTDPFAYEVLALPIIGVPTGGLGAV